MTKKFYKGKNDRVFKATFCNIQNTLLLKEFIERLLNTKINDIKFLRTELNINNVNGKSRTVDVLLEVNGINIHIEVNSDANQIYIHIRNFSYFTEIFNKSTLKGKEYNTKEKFIHFDLSCQLPKKFNDEKRVFYIKDDKDNKYIDNFKIVEYNMDRIMKFWYDKDVKNIIKYLHLIILDLDLDSLNKLLKEFKLSEKDDLFVKKFKERIEELNDDDYFVSSISREEDLERIANTKQTLAYEEGSKKTLLETAKNFIKLNVPLEKISEATGLSIEELKEL